MQDFFITQIKVEKARNLIDFEIPLSEETRKHLIITGENGSGKTSLLLELKRYFRYVDNGAFSVKKYQEIVLLNQKYKTLKSKGESELTPQLENEINQIESQFYQNRLLTSGTFVEFNAFDFIKEDCQKGRFIFAFFEAKRQKALNVPQGVTKVQIKERYGIEENAGNDFIQYIVNLKADRSFARDDNDMETVAKIDEWFSNFEKNLFGLFGSDKVELVFDKKAYNFNLVEEGKEPYNLNQLSDGYSAIFSIVTELIMRMETHKIKSYDIQGVVLIDEIETHLHVALQKKILPFLTAFFPKIQFIVTTHSPFVINSIQDAVICDLEKRFVTTDLSGYSYDTLIESYFESDKYSEVLQKKVGEYEQLIEKEQLTESEKDDLFSLKQYLNEIPKFVSDELAVKLQQIKLKERSKKVQK